MSSYVWNIFLCPPICLSHMLQVLALSLSDCSILEKVWKTSRDVMAQKITLSSFTLWVADLYAVDTQQVKLVHPFPFVAMFTKSYQICHILDDSLTSICDEHVQGMINCMSCEPWGQPYDILCWQTINDGCQIMTMNMIVSRSLTKMSHFQHWGFLLHLKIVHHALGCIHLLLQIPPSPKSSEKIRYILCWPLKRTWGSVILAPL